MRIQRAMDGDCGQRAISNQCTKATERRHRRKPHVCSTPVKSIVIHQSYDLDLVDQEHVHKEYLSNELRRSIKECSDPTGMDECIKLFIRHKMTCCQTIGLRGVKTCSIYLVATAQRLY